MELNLEQYPNQTTFFAAARAAGLTKTTEAFRDCLQSWAAEERIRYIEDRIIGILKERRTTPRNEIYKKIRGDNHATEFTEALRRLQRDTIVILYKDSSQEALRKRGRRSEIIELLDDQPLPDDVKQIVKDMKEVKAIGDPIQPLTLNDVVEKAKSFTELNPVLLSSQGQEPDLVIADDIKREILRPHTGYKITGAPEPATGSTSPLPEAPKSKAKSALISALGAGK